jgi:hypothetical protein
MIKKSVRFVAASLTGACVLSAAGSALAVDVPGLRYVDRYTLPYTPGLNGTTFNGTLFGGISGLDYDALTNSYFGISDDRSQNAPAGGNNAARFYNMSIAVDQNGFVGANPVTINSVTTLQRPDGSAFPTLGVDPESIRIRRTAAGASLIWSSEGASAANTNPNLQNPFIREMNLDGSFVRELTNPVHLNPDGVGAAQTRGVRNNLGFEGLTYSTDGTRIYGAMESSLFQDGPRSTVSGGSRNRIVEFNVVTGNASREFVYQTDAIQALNPANANDNGISEMLAIGEGSFLVVERSFALNEGNSIRIYRIDTAGATDVLGLDSLIGQSYTPVSKTLLLTLNNASLGGNFNPDNVEGLSLGPVLPNGDQSFILVVDNNFNGTQNNQFIMVAVPGPGAAALLGVAGLFAARRRR